MKILLLGKNGQVGWELQRSLSSLGQVIALDRHSEVFCGDLKNLAGLEKSILEIQPDIIVNAAAYTAVDKAESDSSMADLVNHKALQVIASSAKKMDAMLVHYSTDYVFNGKGVTPWKESDPVEPLNIYGKTKLSGESAVIASGCKHLIFRTSWVYASRGSNFVKTMMRLAREREELSIVADQFGAPTGAELIADVTVLAISRPQILSNGIYHLTASGVTTWYEYANFIFELMKANGCSIKISSDRVFPINSEHFITPAMRPLNSRLNCKKIEEQLLLNLPDWKIGVERAVSEILEQFNA